MAEYKKYSEEDLKKFRKDELDRRSKITDQQRSLELEKKILDDLDPDIAVLFELDKKKLESDQKSLELQLQTSTADIIAAQASGYNVSSNMRYCNLYFEPMYDYPTNTYQDNIGGNSNQWDITLVPWSLAPSVMIYSQTTAAPEFAVVDQLILVQDVTGDGFGFEETVNSFSTSTTTFNTSQGVTSTRVRLDRNIFSADSCYASPRDYKLTFASGHNETVEVHPPSPCWQSGALYCTSGSAVNTGIDHSYCSNEDYKSTYSAFKASSLPASTPWGQVVTQTVPWNGTLQTATDTKFVNSSVPMGLIGVVDDFYFELTTSLGTNSPSKGDCAYDAQSTAGLTPASYINGTTHYGSPLQINAPQWSKQTIAILGQKAEIVPSGIVGTSSSTPYSYIHNPVMWFGAIQDPGFDSVASPSGQEMMPSEGIYGIVRDYAYSENLEDCQIPPPPDIEVCTDSSSPSYYLTTELDCAGASITNYINGSNGSWNPIPGVQGCCAVDCSGFIMAGSSTDASFGVNNGTITIDFTNGITNSPVGNYHNTSNQHAYDVSLTNSNGVAIVQNSNNAYASGAAIQDATCDTTNNSPIVNCNSNSQITVGMSVTGTGIPGTKFVGAITGGVPGAVTAFSLSSNASSNISTNANATLTNTTLTFAIFPYMFQWGGLPPNTGSDFYTISVIDDDDCEYTQVFVIGEALPIVGCTASSAINYSSSNQSQCSPDCCIFCNATTGYTEDSSGSFLGNEFSSLTASQVPETIVSASDGIVTINGGLNSSLIGYLTSSMSYKYTIHGLNSSGDFASAGGVIATDTSTLSQGITASFTSLDHGYYGVLVQIEDSSTGSDAKLEKCFQWVSADVSVNVCLDASATNYNTSVPGDLQISNPSLCSYPAGCDCIFNLSYTTTTCGVIIEAFIQCDPLSNISWVWTDPNGVSLAPGSSSNVQSLPTQLIIASISGAYTFELTDSGGTGVCVTTGSVNVVMPVCGCTDSLAINYDPSATTDDGSCVYCVYGCMDQTASNYNSIATCSDGSCVFPYGGCTDPLASNYDAGASFDDGSCIYEGCLDSTALNYLYTCAGVYNPSINLNTPACCSYCIPPVMSAPVPAAATASAVTCNVANADGSCSITNISLPSGATTWTWEVSTPVALVYTSPQLAVGDTAQTQSNLNVGAYLWEAKDGLQCIATGNFSIGTTPGNCGCTDPLAANYNPSALIDDGSCVYPGCTDPNANNYNPAAIQDDGTCNYDIIPNPCQLTAKTKRKIDGKIFGCLTLKGAMYLRKIKIGYADDCSVMNQWKLILVNYLLHKTELDCMFNCSDTMTSNTIPSTFPNTNTTNYIDPFIRFMNEQCDKCTEDPDCVKGRLRQGPA